jgi:hypothetical protein
MTHSFIILQTRVTRPDPLKPDRQITDFEDTSINLDHVQMINKGVTDDTCMLIFPGNITRLIKGSLEEVHAKIHKINQPKLLKMSKDK